MINDPVKYPNHYRWIPVIECKDVICHFDFWRGSAMKYLWRSGRKEGESEERALEKAMESIQNRLAFIRGASREELQRLDEEMP